MDKRRSLFKVLLMVALGFLLLTTFCTVVNEIGVKKHISYSLTVDQKEYFAIGYGDYDFKMVPLGRGIESYRIVLQEKIADDISGQIGWAIRKGDGTEVINGVLNVDNLRLANVIELTLNGIELEEKEYTVRLYSRISDNIIIALNESGEPCNEQVFVNTYINWYYAILIGMVSIFVVLVCLIKCKNEGLLFVLLSMVVGSVLIFVMPPCTAPDEFRHFLRAYTISEGLITCETYTSNEYYYYQTLAECEIPQEIFELKLLSERSVEHWTNETNGLMFFPKYLKQLFTSNIDTETLRVVPYHGTTSINPVAYLPQIVFIWVAKLLNMNALGMFYMARFGNLLCATFLVWLARKVYPEYKDLFAVLYFIPGLAFLRSSCSTDSLLWGVSLLVLAFVLRINKDKEALFINKKTYLTIVLLLSLIALIKLPYILLICVLMIFDVKKFVKKTSDNKIKNRLQQYGIILSMVAIACLVFLLSHIFLTRYSETVDGNKIDYLTYIFENPMEVGSIVINAFLGSLMDYIEAAFSYPDTNNMYFFLYILIILYFGIRRKEFGEQSDKLAYMTYIALGMWLAIVGTFYFIGPAPNLGYIWGVQGRYIFPLLPVLGIGLSNCNVILAEDNEKEISVKKYYYIVVILCIYVLDIYKLYWL